MKIMIDSNVLLDVLLARELFVKNSAQILRLCEQRKIVGVISASSVTDLFYIIRKAIHDTNKTYELMETILNILDICSVEQAQIQAAFSHRAKDFEDCLLAICAKHANCNCIITRNKKDFSEFDITLYTPDEYLESFEYSD